MNLKLLVSLFLLIAGLSIVSAQDAPQLPDEGAFFSGEYRNILAEWGLSDEEIQARIDAAFQQLFYGDDDNERVYYPVGDAMAYIIDVNNDDIRTEGISYGMMLSVQLDKQEEFNRLWKWSWTYLYHKEGPWQGYFCWHARTDGDCIDNNPASDGEIWYVTALFFASARWGNGEGIFNYEAEAQSILNTMLHMADSNSPLATNLFDADTKLAVFVPQLGQMSQFTDPSYQAPHYYEIWARLATQDNDFWLEAIDAARQHWRDAAHPVTGLSSNYTEFTGEPRPMGDYGGVFYADSWRTAMMIAMDYSWFKADEWQVEQTNRYLRFFHDLGIGRYNTRFEIDGTPEGNQHRSTGLIAMNAVATLASTEPFVWDFIEEFWETPIPTGQYRYYDGLLYLMALLQTSGNFQIYMP